MQVSHSITQFRELRHKLSGRVGLVPTMGYLHDGHLSLIDYARRETDSAIVSIFVNPAQFNERDDFDAYPRNLPRDLALLERANVDLVFVPTAATMYTPRHQTVVEVRQVTQRLEGAHRPGHFTGVATIVAKLFNIAQPDVAYFGQKDAQQCVTIRQMTRDLNFPIEIAICPIRREPDGLAMSSRNVRLSLKQRKAATVLYRSIQKVKQAYEDGEWHPDVLRQIACDTIMAEPLAKIDYVSLADPGDLHEIEDVIDGPALILLAVRIGEIRLIDNCLLPVLLNNRQRASLALGAD